MSVTPDLLGGQNHVCPTEILEGQLPCVPASMGLASERPAPLFEAKRGVRTATAHLEYRMDNVSFNLPKHSLSLGLLESLC